MAHAHTVLMSVNSDDGTHCVDVFRRTDGSFGFDLFRRDPEDSRGWYPVGHYGSRSYATVSDARAAATDAVPWAKFA